MKIFILSCSIFLLTSCGQAKKMLTGFQDPHLETTASIEKYINEHDMQQTVNLTPKDKQSMQPLVSVFNKKIPDAILFDSNGQELIYREGGETCTAGLFRVLPGVTKNSVFRKGTHNLFETIDKYTITLPTGKSQVAKSSDYYLLINWAKFAGKKNKENVLEWEKLATQNKSVNIEVIKLNMDIREGWGVTEEEIKLK